MAATARILVIEDEPDMQTILRDNLEFEGYRVALAATGELGLTRAIEDRPDLLLLDVMLPGISGLDVCRKLRAQGRTDPIILITARTSEVDRIRGLDCGADDYVGKPFSIGEVLARVRVQLRRTREQARQMPQHYRFGGVAVDLQHQTVRRNGKPVVVSSGEFRLLSYLIQHRGEWVTREQIMTDVFGYVHAPLTRSVDNLVSKLRSKLEPDPQRPRYILTGYGAGYRLAV